MKIIHVISNLELAGAQNMCCNLLCALKDYEEDLTVISLFDSSTALTEKLTKNGIKVICLGKKMGMDLSMIRKLRKIFKKENPDIIHAHADVLKYVGLATLFSRVKIVHTIHTLANKESGKADLLANKYLYRKQKAFPVALTPVVQGSIRNKYDIPIENIPVIYNGIDLSSCIEKTSYSTNGEFKILHIGRFSEEKNHVGLINAFEILHKRVPNSSLNLIGDGPLKEKIVDYVKEKDLADSVNFLGLQPNVYPHLNETDVFALPSIFEGMPMTLIEAMGTGLPIVASNVGGIPDMLKDGSNAILTEVNDEAIANAFIAFAESEDLRKAYGQQGLIDAKAFSSQIMARDYYDYYRIVSKK